MYGLLSKMKLEKPLIREFEEEEEVIKVLPALGKGFQPGRTRETREKHNMDFESLRYTSR